MRIIEAITCALLGAAALTAAAAAPVEEPFDACMVFTQADAEKTLGTTMAAEPVNPKAKRPKVIPVCTYNGFKDGKPVAATAQFRFGRSDQEARDAFEEARLQLQTKPLILPNIEAAFWSAKTGQMHIRKGRAWITVSVGGAKPSERDMDVAKKLAEMLAAKV